MNYRTIVKAVVPGSMVDGLFRLRAEGILKTLRREKRSIELEDVIKDIDEISLTCIPEQPWNMHLIEVAALCMLVKRLKVKNVFEIGTFDGRTTINIARALPDGGTITTLNLAAPVASGSASVETKGAGYRFASRIEELKIEQVFGDSMEFRPAVAGKKYDLVILDGDHSERYVMHDTELALQLLSDQERAMLAWHDIDYPSVHRALKHMETRLHLKYWHIANTRLGIAFPFAKGTVTRETLRTKILS